MSLHTHQESPIPHPPDRSAPLVAITQGILLDVYIISSDHTALSTTSGSSRLPDGVWVRGRHVSGYRNCKLEQHPPNINVEGKRKGESTRWRKVEGVLGKHAMPFYVWMVYSVLLVAKVVIIFKSEIPNKISTTDALSPQLLKIVLSLSCIVFALLVEGQATIGATTERETYIRSLAQGTSMEVLDSVTFISLLIQSESGFLFPDYMENIIIAFSCINFFLPGIALVKLSRSNYGSSAIA
nr:uncharacterized protein LOC113818585 [Penaeus vannamei]